MRPCPNCGVDAGGNFCSTCGSTLGARTCTTCSAELAWASRFCHKCGTPAPVAAGTLVPTPRAGRSERMAWLVAGTIAGGLVLMIVWRMFAGTPARTVADMANAGNAASNGAAVGAPPAADPGGGLATAQAPDISAMTPEDRFLRLNNRVMEAAQRADSATVINFTPMALGAYAQLPGKTADDRYHAAVLNAQVGRFSEALALADTILAEAPGHLLAFVVRGDVAELRGDAPAAAAAARDFLAAWPSENTARRIEYADHRNVLDDFRQRAEPRR